MILTTGYFNRQTVSPSPANGINGRPCKIQIGAKDW